jgi:hypothetical protein
MWNVRSICNRADVPGQNVKHFNCIRKWTWNSSVIKFALCAVGFMHFIFCVFSPATVEMAKRTTSWLDTTLPMWHICRLCQLWKRSLRKNIHHHQEALEWQSLYFHSSHILMKTKYLVYMSVWYITGARTARGGGIVVTAEKTILTPHKNSHGWWRWQCFRLQPSAYCVSLQLISTCPKWFLPLMVVTISLYEQNGQTSGSAAS